MMPHLNADRPAARENFHRAAIFVDYENLYTLLQHKLDHAERADAYITEIIEALRVYLSDHEHARVALVLAYADFSQLQANGQDLQRSLYLQGTEPRFVPASLQHNAAEMQLCVEAMEVLHHRTDIQSFTLVTGNRPYLPLIQQFRRYGRSVHIAALEPLPEENLFLAEQKDLFLDARGLLSDAARRRLLRNAHSQPNSTETPEVACRSLTLTASLTTLELIEEYFGQYDEIYLTPLLRKMSEVFDETQYDPKEIISDLEQAGAVWLEKRRGFPYDYTVLLLNAEHPDVQRIQQSFFAEEAHFDSYEDDDPETPYDTGHAAGSYPDDDANPRDRRNEAWNEEMR